MPEHSGNDEQVLTDSAADERLARDGIVALPLVAPADLAPLEEAYWSLVPPDEDGIRLDYLRHDRQLKGQLAQLLASFWEGVIEQAFTSHYPVYSSFVVKHPGSDSALYLHRDLYVDDERFRRTFAMWMPFVDTGPGLDNGPLSFVPGSHLIRHGSFGPNAAAVFSPYQNLLQEHLRPFTVPAGTALVYDARMLHASAPNNSPDRRLAVGCLLARRDQPVIQVVATGRRHRRVHRVDREYFVKYAPSDIAADGMPMTYPVIDEYDEEPGVSAEAVLGDTAFAGAACREVLVPPDLSHVAGARHDLVTRRGPVPPHRRDLEVTAGLLPRAPRRLLGRAALSTVGRVGVAECGRRGPFRRGRPIPAWLRPALPELPDGGRAAVIVADPGARLRLSLPEGGEDDLTDLRVLECPAIRSGAATVDHVAEFDLGTELTLDPGEKLHVWNEGPGPLVLLVRRRGRSRRPPTLRSA